MSIPVPDDLALLKALYDRYPWLLRQHDARDTRTVAEVVENYLAEGCDNQSERHAENRTRTLKLFVEAYGERRLDELGPLTIREFLRNNPGWEAPDTKSRVNSDIQAVWNWATRNRVTKENPFKGFSLGEEKRTGRDMTKDEFQAVLRHVKPHFRRLVMMMKMTGARPCELRLLRWTHIRWDRGLAILPDHKTRKKTGKPRVLVLIPNVLKLLSIIRRDQKGPAAVELRRILEAGAPVLKDGETIAYRVRAIDAARRMRELGYSHRSIHVAYKRLGASIVRVGGWGDGGGSFYELPAGTDPLRRPEDFVFLNIWGTAWTRHGIQTTFRRIKKTVGLPADCKLYSIRHFFATWAIKHNVHLKAVATLLGHTTTAMVERTYVHLDRDDDYLQLAAAQATALVNHKPMPLPAPVDVRSYEELAATAYPRATPKPRKAKKPRPAITPATRAAYELDAWARQQCPDLSTDDQVYAWLLPRPEARGKLPPTAASFRRALCAARKHLDGAGKRAARYRNATPVQTSVTAPTTPTGEPNG